MAKRRPRFRVHFPNEQIKHSMRDALRRGLREEVRAIRIKSQFFCPKKTGNLVNSWDEIYYEDQLRAVFGYKAPYAWVQHERNYRHKPPTRNKYLKLAIDSRIGFIKDHIAQIIKDELGGK